VTGSTVDECLDCLVEKFHALKKALLNKNGRLKSNYAICVNQEDAHHEALAKPVKDGDNIHIILLIAGGIS
jgi:molybdopterin converting factor small subunit